MIAAGRVKKIAEPGIFESEIFTQSGLSDVSRWMAEPGQSNTFEIGQVGFVESRKNFLT